jgi:hypothetical protein
MWWETMIDRYLYQRVLLFRSYSLGKDQPTDRRPFSRLSSRVPNLKSKSWRLKLTDSTLRPHTGPNIQVLTAASMKFRVFWDVGPCSQVDVDRSFRGAYCLHHHGDDRPCSASFLRKLVVAQRVKKLPALYRTQMFITVFTTARNWSLSRTRRIQSKPCIQFL